MYLTGKPYAPFRANSISSSLAHFSAGLQQALDQHGLDESAEDTHEREPSDDWRLWLAGVSPHLTHPGERHIRFWRYISAVEPLVRPRPYIAAWPRKGGKSTTGEHGVAYLADHGIRSYCLYVCGTQAMANQHVGSIETILGRIGGALARPAKNTQGYQRGWKQSTKVTESGFIQQGIGLDSIMRGAKLDDAIPDLIVLDDIDERHDSPAATAKKIQIITETILPAAAPHAVVFFLQNLIIPNGVCAQLVDGRAQFLMDRIVDGPYKAIEGIQTEKQWSEEYEREITVITGGTPTWVGQDLATCQERIITVGWTAFDRESQNNVKEVEGALWTTDQINATRVSKAECPALTRTVVAVDPPTTSKNTSNEAGIIAIGRTANRHGYVLTDRSQVASPSKWGRRAVLLHDQVGADCIVIEGNQGGEMAKAVLVNAAQALHREGLRTKATIRVKMVYASKGKRARAEPVQQLYEEKTMHHVGDLTKLEEQMTTWNASDGSESPDRVDALVWGAYELGLVRSSVDHTRI